MARTVIVASLTVLSLFLGPQRVAAQDIWAWIKELSGPGPFHGAQFDLQLACVGAIKREGDYVKWVLDAGLRAQALLSAYPSAADKAVIDIKAEAGAFNQKIKETAGANSVTRELWATEATTIANKIGGCQTCGRQLKDIAALYRDIATSLRAMTRMLDASVGNFAVSTGVFYSACRGERSTAPLAIGVTTRFLNYTDETGEHAGGNEIRLTTLGVSAMWRPINGAEHPKLDWVDVGVAVSRYSFTNAGANPGSFPHFSGLMFEPIRLEFHAPSYIRNHPNYWWASIPFVQISRVIFPAGFPPNAFGPNLIGPKAERLPAEWIRAGNIFFDLTPIVDRLGRRSRR